MPLTPAEARKELLALKKGDKVLILGGRFFSTHEGVVVEISTRSTAHGTSKKSLIYQSGGGEFTTDLRIDRVLCGIRLTEHLEAVTAKRKAREERTEEVKRQADARMDYHLKKLRSLGKANALTYLKANMHEVFEGRKRAGAVLRHEKVS